MAAVVRASRLLAAALYSVVTAPAVYVLRHGPTRVGAWQGMRDSALCAQATGASESFWEANDEECRAMVRAREDAFVAVIVGAGVAVVAYKFVAWTWFRFFVARPLLRDFAAALRAEHKNLGALENIVRRPPLFIETQDVREGRVSPLPSCRK